MTRTNTRSLTFVSVGSAIDMPGANTSLVLDCEKRILLDCGYAIPLKFCHIFPRPDFLDAVYLSHQHADHAFGLPALLAWMKAMGRQRPLRILHGPRADSWIRTILDVGYPGSFDPSVCFPIEFCALDPETPTHWDDITLRIAQSTHKVPNWSLRVEGQRLSVAYSGDGNPSRETVNLFQGVTHLVHECSWATKLKDGHGDVESLLAAVPGWNVEHLYLVHALVSHRAQILSQVATFEGSTCVTLPEPGDVISLDL